MAPKKRDSAWSRCFDSVLDGIRLEFGEEDPRYRWAHHVRHLETDKTGKTIPMLTRYKLLTMACFAKIDEKTGTVWSYQPEYFWDSNQDKVFELEMDFMKG